MQSPNLEALKSLRDELKLKIHLAGMEVRSEWEQLEPQLERALSSASVATTEALADLKKRLDALSKRLN
ncbi:MAG: hypothetical protein QM817_31540 [Archangium sp.]